jgi:hypothetical protein
MTLKTRLRLASALAGFAIVVSSAGVANAATFAGTWAYSATLGRPVIATSAPVCVLRQSGNTLSGSCKGPNGIGSGAGIVNGRAILLQWHHIATTSIGRTGTATYHGVWGSDGVVRGTWVDTVWPGVTGTFTAQKL